MIDKDVLRREKREFFRAWRNILKQPSAHFLFFSLSHTRRQRCSFGNHPARKSHSHILTLAFLSAYVVFFWQSLNYWLMSAGVTEHQLLCLANKIHVTPGLHPSSGRTEQRARPGGQVTLLLNTPNPQVYCLSSQWCLSFVWKHNSSGQSLPGACAPSQRHTVYNPLYSLACSHSRVPSFHELAASRNEHGLPRECRHSGAKTIVAILSLRCRPLRQQSDARSHENKSLLQGYFYRKLQWERESSGNGCRR